MNHNLSNHAPSKTIWLATTLLAFLFALLAAPSVADDEEPSAPTGKIRSALALPDGVDGAFTAGLDNTNSTVDALSYSLALQLGYTRGKTAWSFNTKRQFGETSIKTGDQKVRQTAANNYAISTGVTRTVSDRLQWRALAGSYHDRVKGIDADRSALVIPVYTVWATDQSSLAAGLGVGYRQKRVRLQDDQIATNSSAAVGISTDYTYRFTPTLALHQSLFAYGDFGSRDNDAVELTIGLAQSISPNLSLTVNYSYSFHEQPLRPDLDDTTSRVQLQLVYKL